MAKIDILISTNGSADSSESSISNNLETNAKSSESIATKSTGSSRNSILKNVYVHQLLSSSVSALKSTFDLAKSNYGNFTGNYLAQQKIDNTFSAASSIVSFGSSIVTGAIVGGVAGAAAGAVVASVNIGMNAWQNNINYNQSLRKANFSASFNSQRIGIVLSNGNR